MAIKSMDAKELKNLIDQSEDFLLIDVREQEEWDAAHIKEAKFMPLSAFKEHAKELTNKEQKIILQCRSGKRSLDAALYLESQGFSDLTNLNEGILGWVENDFPIES